MPPNASEHALVTLLRQCYLSPSCRASAIRSRVRLSSSAGALHTSAPRLNTRPRHRQLPRLARRAFSSVGSKNEAVGRIGGDLGGNGESRVSYAGHGGSGGGHEDPEQRIAILGGGITGLTAAYYITRELPNAKVTIYEAGDKLGGWLQSETVEVDGGTILLEKGPRTLRPGTAAALVTLDIIQELGLRDELLVGWKDSPAAQNRYIYYPDHLVRMPGPGRNIIDQLWSVMTEPVFTGLYKALFERGVPPRKCDDESIRSFLTRRFGSPAIADNMVSAVFHGIYAGDIEKLSAKSIMGSAYHMEKMHGSLTEALFETRGNGYSWKLKKDVELRKELLPQVQELADDLGKASVFTFEKGIGSFSDAIESSLRKNGKVTFRTKDRIAAVDYDLESNGIKITNAHGTTQTYNRAISTISSTTLNNLSHNLLPSLSHTPSVTVMVVNLWYPTPLLLPEQGFGYLIPRSIPYEQNPECALGVVFDSDAIQGQDTVPGTKVTVMMGGHWWDGFAGMGYPSEDEGLEMAISVMRRHLKIEELPALVKVHLRENCIPQYTVGHSARMSTAHSELLSTFKGKLAVAGSAYTGVGMNDCVAAARRVVMGIKEGRAGTGLEEFCEGDGERWVKVYREGRREGDEGDVEELVREAKREREGRGGSR